MHQHSSLEELAHFMESGRGVSPESRAFRMPVTYLLLGRKERALERVDRFQLELGERTDLATTQYYGFADALRGALGRSN